MGLPIVQVDAFTDKPFAGNPAAVCILPGPRDERRTRIRGDRVILGGQVVTVVQGELV